MHRPASLLSVLAILAGCSSPGGESDGKTSTACDPDGLATRTISCVQNFSPGDGAGYGQDRFPEVVYGEPKGGGAHGGSTDVLSLGKGGSITVGFGSASIVDREGPDFIVFENAFFIGDDPTKPFKELGEVSVSEDGETWTTFPCKKDAYPYTGCAGWNPVFAGSAPGISAFDPKTAGGDDFDLADIGVERARFVRVKDISNFGAGGNAGFDLDAMAIVNPDVTPDL
jgi:hypothetical protein